MKLVIRLLLASTLICAALESRPDAQSPIIDSVEGTPFFDQTPITITGSNFNSLTGVTINGATVGVVSQSPTELVVQPFSFAPGLYDVTVGTSFGLTTLTDGLRLWPTLRAESTGLGGFLTIEVDNDDLGSYWVVLGIDSLPLPLVIPGIEYGLLINHTAPKTTVARAAFTAPGSELIVRAIPNDPNLAGVNVFLQSLNEFGNAPVTAMSFSNLESLTLTPTRPGGLSYSENPASYPLFQSVFPPNVPSVTGDVDFYSITPPLPAGLTFAPGNGFIFGIPVVATVPTTYIVTAHNAFGSTSTFLDISTDNTFGIVSCSLGCFDTGNQIVCNINDVPVNPVITVDFSLPVDPSSINGATFQVQDVVTGLVPPATFSIDPTNPNRIVYRPLLTFNSAGLPVFGFKQAETYEIRIPGSNATPGPFIMSTTGIPVSKTLRCVVTASGGVLDAVPGSPEVETLVDVVTGYDPDTGLPNSFAFDVPANGATNVLKSSMIQFAFADLMTPGSLLNPVTGVSPTLSVEVDQDGDLATTADRIDWPGEFSVTLDLSDNTTDVFYTPDQDYPSVGSGVLPPRIVVDIASGVVDLAGNALILPGPISFVAEQ